MTTIQIFGWNVGFDKVKFTLLLKSALEYSLSDAKSVTDAIMANETVELQVAEAEVEAVLSSMHLLGARCGAVVAHE